MEKLFSQFPKQRPAITDQYRKIFEDGYINSREGQSSVAKIALKLEEWMHKQVAKAPLGFPVLEIGAGTLNHLPFEKLDGPYDIVEPQKVLYSGKPNLEKIRSIYSTVADVPHENQYARIISIAVLEHITDLPQVIARIATLLSPNGEFRSGIPTEGGLLWYLAWRFGTGFGFWLKYRVSYKLFMKHEHVNNAGEIESIIKYFFEDVTVSRFPLGGKNTSFYSYINAKKPKAELARAFLNT